MSYITGAPMWQRFRNVLILNAIGMSSDGYRGKGRGAVGDEALATVAEVVRHGWAAAGFQGLLFTIIALGWSRRGR